MTQTECFKIQILRGEIKDNPEIQNLSPILRICNSRSRLSPFPKVIEADPFLFVKDDILYLFYESKDYKKAGVIKMVSTTDLSTWTKPQTVLSESCHLSYPFVFQEGGITYMIPETCAFGEVRIYKADNDQLSHFTYVTTLLKQKEEEDWQISFSDSSIYKKDDIYYLMTTVMRNQINELLLFYSKSLAGPYTEHPSSPVVRNMKYGRNAGCILEQEGKLYRVAQDCVKRYGDNVHLVAVDQMNETTYQEHVVKDNIIPTDQPFYAEGGHQFNIVQFNDSIIVATDAKEYHKFPIAKVRLKLCKVLSKLFTGK